MMSSPASPNAAPSSGILLTVASAHTPSSPNVSLRRRVELAEGVDVVAQHVGVVGGAATRRHGVGESGRCVPPPPPPSSLYAPIAAETNWMAAAMPAIGPATAPKFLRRSPILSPELAASTMYSPIWPIATPADPAIPPNAPRSWVALPTMFASTRLGRVGGLCRSGRSPASRRTCPSLIGVSLISFAFAEI